MILKIIAMLIRAAIIYHFCAEKIVSGNANGQVFPAVIDRVLERNTTNLSKMDPTQESSLLPSIPATSQPTNQPTEMTSNEDYPNPTPSINTSLISSSPVESSTYESETPYQNDITSFTPTVSPTYTPSMSSSMTPTQQVSSIPMAVESSPPSKIYSHLPSFVASTTPSLVPSLQPSREQSLTPSLSPSSFPSKRPSLRPSMLASSAPSYMPSLIPSLVPNMIPIAFIDDNNEEKTIQIDNSYHNYLIYAVGIGALAMFTMSVLFVKFRRRGKQNIIIFADNLVEDLSAEGEKDDKSQFSMWREKMASIFHQNTDGAETVQHQSVFDASTIKSDGSWVRRTVVDTDLRGDKPIPNHIIFPNC